VNVEFQKIGLRGVSLISASGDSGANGRTDGDCSLAQRLRPPFPASSPYVTAVGATQLNNPVYNLPNSPPACTTSGYPCPSGGTEVAVSYDVSGFTSGGGFSDLAPTPAWQKAAIQAYFTSGVQLPPTSYYNQTGRGFPDVAAIGHNTLIYQGGIQPVGGTSASAPIVASIISLLNEASVKKSGKPLGFLNPFLYAAAAADPSTFHDITVGDNKCTEQGCFAACQGYYAYKGWDPVTGLGSLNYARLLNYIQTH
jgi:tripeptidyl-peptidase-1